MADKEPQQITLEEDGPLGPAGTQVWVNDPADVQKAPAKKAAAETPAPKKATGK